MKLIYLVLAALLISSCSVKRQGERFTPVDPAAAGDGVQPGKTEPPAVVEVERQSCSFQGIDGVSFEVSDAGYSDATEKAITDLFQKYVTPLDHPKPGFVKYQDWRKSKEDLGTLCAVLDQFKNADVSDYSREEKLVFYMNAYNVMTIELILNNYPDLEIDGVKSIKHVRGLSPSGEPVVLQGQVWKSIKWNIAGQDVTLDEVENGIIKKLGEDALATEGVNRIDSRYHVGINCASLSCPPLRNEAFTISQYDSQLDEMARAFVNGSYNEIFFYKDDKEGDLALSKIFQWYKADFETDPNFGSVESFLSRYLSNGREDGLTSSDLESPEIFWFQSFLPYSFNLNEVLPDAE